MGKTVIEKIIEHNTGKEVKPGDIVTVNVDRVMIHDIFIPFVAEKFKEMGYLEKLEKMRIEEGERDYNVTLAKNKLWAHAKKLLGGSSR